MACGMQWTVGITSLLKTCYFSENGNIWGLTWKVNIYYLKHEVHFKKSNLNTSHVALHGFQPLAHYSICQDNIYKIICHNNDLSMLNKMHYSISRCKSS